LNVDLCGSTFNTKLTVWDGCEGSERAYNDDSCELQSEVFNVPIVYGEDYYIQVGGYGTESGTGDLTLSVLEEGTHIPPGPVSGTWELVGSPYIIDGEITIPPGEQLIIEPGGQIVFSDLYKFNISGTLLAEGTASDMILFTAQDSLVGWHGIRFQNTTGMDSSKVVFCNLAYGNATGTGADANGGAISLYNSSNVLIKNSILTNNSADNYGGAIYCDSSDPDLINITSSGNNALEGGAIYVVNSNPYLKNSILWGDTAPEIIVDNGIIDVNYTNVQGGWPSGIGNLDVDPNFLDGTNYIPSIINPDCTAQNPCVDAGDPSDPIGNEPYPHGGRINMGAYGSSSQAAFTAQVDDPVIPPSTIYYPDLLHVFNTSPIILPGGDLQVESGSVIIFYGDFTFEVHGPIDIGGAARNDSVLFTSDIDAYGGGPNQSESWQGFVFSVDAPDGSTFNNVIIENAVNGINLGSVSAFIDNTKILYEETGPIRNPGVGILIGDGSDAQIRGSEITGYPVGIDILNEGLRETTSAVLTNNRVRNSPESSRLDDVGIKISGDVETNIDSCEVYEYLIGIEIDNDPSTGTFSTPVLTNNRVRNSPQSSRQEAVGMKISGNVAANIDNCDIEDYDNGIQYIGSGDTFPERETPVFTNNRVRNSPQSSRTTLLKGIYVDSLATITIDNCDFDDYGTAIEINNSNTARETSTPVLTNNRVRNSPQSSREILVGLRMSGDINGIIENNEFVECDSALVIIGSDTAALIQYNLIYLTEIIANSTAIHVSNADDLTINDNTVYQYEYGLISTGTVIDFFNNIFWHDSPTVEPVTIEPAFLTGTYNDISRPGGLLYPGTGNINSDPIFVDVVAEDFNIEWNSPCIDGGDPASPFDPDGTVNDIGLYYYHQPDILETPANYVFSLDSGIINLSWDLVSGAIGYNIYRSLNPYSGWSLHDFNVKALAWNESVSGEKKFYFIKAYNSRSISEALKSYKKKNYLNLK